MSNAGASRAKPSQAWRRIGAAPAWRAASLLWLLALLMVAVHQWHFWHESRIDVDVMALLPRDEQAPEVALATQRLLDPASRQVVVVLGAQGWDATRRAAAAWRRSLQGPGSPLQEQPMSDPSAMGDALQFYLPWRDRLLTAAQREFLTHSPTEALERRALAALYQPGFRARLSDWTADPLSLWPQWWSARAAGSHARPRDGELWVFDEGRDWLVLRYEITGSAFRVDGHAVYGNALRDAEAAARAVEPALAVLRAGVPLHAEAAAAQATAEVNTIGWGSLTAVVLLLWLAFRSLRAILLVSLSLLAGLAAALSLTAWAFGHVHIITLVFGATLAGVGEDYGIHYFASRQAHAEIGRRSLMQQLMPGLALALVTSVLGYLSLGLAPFPGLRQMAFFSAVSLIATMLTVACWFPWLDRGHVRGNRLASWLGASLRKWPRLPNTPRAWIVYVSTGLVTAAGLTQLHPNDDVRQLQASPPDLVRQQRHLGDLLGLPTPAQFFLVQAGSVEAVLQREESLKQRLDGLVKEGRLGGYSAVSDWVPSAAQQRADAELTARVEGSLLKAVGAQLAESLTRPSFAGGTLSVSSWLEQPASVPVRAQWLGDVPTGVASVVLIHGLHDGAMLPRLARAAEGIDGVRWVDRPAEISALLGRYRVAMAGLVVVGHALVLLALTWRYGRTAWRAWLPTALATVVTLALLAAAGQPLQLFNVLALLLLLGVGVDYGIFLLEHVGDGSAWLAVVLGAASTWLAFGLLALSSTPALRAFGLTLGIGLVLVTLLAPAVRAPSPSSKQ